MHNTVHSINTVHAHVHCITRAHVLEDDDFQSYHNGIFTRTPCTGIYVRTCATATLQWSTTSESNNLRSKESRRLHIVFIN